MSARDDFPWAATQGPSTLAALDEIDRLRDECQRLREGGAQLAVERDELTAENEAIKTAIGQQIGRNRQLVNQVSHARRKRRALRVERDALRQWQREACEWLAAIDKTVAQHAKPPVPNLLDLLRRAGKEV